MNDKKNYLLPLLFSVVMVIGMIIGFKLRESTWTKRPIVEKADYNKLEEVFSLVENKYVDTIAKEKVIDKLIENLLEELDPHSFFISAKDLESVNESLEGNFEGIGIEFYVLKDTIIVVSPISGGPSEALGIMSGDKIIRIEDSVVAGIGITNNQVIKKLRGEKGTKVKVGISRRNAPELLDFVITRDKIPIFSVDVGYKVDQETGYIRINRFSATTYREFMKELKKLKKQGMEKLVIDLRQNPGGYLNAATMIADELIRDKKLLVYTEGKAYDRKEYNSRSDGVFEKGELAIIIDEGSASASEILAGAVQDWDRGVVVGRRSFGKGLVQEQYNLRDGSAVRLTVARYYTPSGRSIQKPYNNGSQEYHEEIVERYYHGEYTSKDSIEFADSLKYFTSEGKPVYGGGGIMPDVFIPLDTTVDFQYLARIRGYVPEFVYDYYSKQQEFFEQFRGFDDFNKNYHIPNAVLQEFIDDAESRGLKVSKSDLDPLKDKVKIILKAFVARQLWKNEGFYPVINTIDDTFLKTLEILESRK